MPCYFPLTGWRGRQGAIVFKRQSALDPTRPMRLPCGQCAGCRLEKSRQWAVRCVHEASQWEYNCFLTLTYRTEDLPKSMSLEPEHMTKFWKRLRKKYGQSIRYFYCGEYGERSGRPHYHACVFNHAFSDQTLWKADTGSGSPLYRSAELERLWPYGFSTIGQVTFESAAYVARYVMKKRTGDASKDYYSYVDSDGVVHDRLPEFVRMSRRPGIGAGWIKRYRGDVYPGDFVILGGHKFRPPRFYDEQLEEEVLKDIKKKRVSNAEKHSEDQTPERRRVRNAIATERAMRLVYPQQKERL